MSGRRHPWPLRERADGYVLPMSIGIMMVLAIVAGSVVLLGAANQNATRRDNADDSALSLAEDGVTEALAVLAAADSPLSPTAVGTGSTSINSGIAGYSGSLTGSTWTLMGSGTVTPDVSGAGDVTRSVSLKVNVTTAGTPWEYLFSDAQSGCLTIPANAVVVAPIYTRSNLCLGDNARLTGSPVDVEGTVTLGTNASIGDVGTPVAQADLVGGCTGGVPDPHACASGDGVHAMSLTQTAAGLAAPAVDLTSWYANATPGPSNACTSGNVPGGFDDDTTLNGSRPAFSLTSGAAYDCQVWSGPTLVGRLAWNPGANTLTALGTIYFDGPIALSGTASYVGRATIYSSSTIASAPGTHLCGVPACDATWNPNSNLLVLVAGDSTAPYGFDLADDSVYQGGAYAVTDYRAGTNVQNWGPVIARQIAIADHVGQHMPLASLPPGTPGAASTIQKVSGTWRG